MTPPVACARCARPQLLARTPSDQYPATGGRRRCALNDAFLRSESLDGSCRAPTAPPAGPPAPPLLRREAEVGECVLAVVVGDQPGHLAAADVEQVRCARAHQSELQSARLPPPAEVVEHEHTLPVELAVFVYLDAEVLPGA